jgi:BioD-like phosphotransacetylase family protein
MPKKAVFIAATGQDVGKTTICLGIIAALRKRYSRVGFIKPVGQVHIKIDKDTMVDKDAVLFKEYFKLPTVYKDMSPVILPKDFTRRYLDGEIGHDELRKKIRIAYDKVYSANEYTVVEGTGHVGVGSIVNMNNAQVAAELGVEMVILVPGGLGSAHDELAQNIAICEDYGVKIRGIILNQVIENKRDMLLEYFPKSLKAWGIPLIGCVPFNRFLNTPTMKDFEILFLTNLISGDKHHYRHFTRKRLVAGSLESYLEEELIHNELLITPASREDIILAFVERNIRHKKETGKDYEGGLILTSKNPPSQEIINKLNDIDVPALYVPLCSYDVMKMITHYKAKIRMEDSSKVEQAIKIVEENIDFDRLCALSE